MRVRLSQLDQSGATNLQRPAWDDATGRWVPVDAAGTTASALTTTYMPLTTVVGGVPELVWDADDSLIPTEIPL